MRFATISTTWHWANLLEIYRQVLPRPRSHVVVLAYFRLGAAETGGHFNRQGEAALYLSLDVMTSFAKCTQGMTQRLHPLAICEYDVDCEPVADIRTDALRAAARCIARKPRVPMAGIPAKWARSALVAVAERLKVKGFARADSAQLRTRFDQRLQQPHPLTMGTGSAKPRYRVRSGRPTAKRPVILAVVFIMDFDGLTVACRAGGVHFMVGAIFTAKGLA